MVTPQQCRKLDAHMARVCRVKLQGRGASNEGEHTTTWSYARVLQYCKLVPSEKELPVRRLSWHQQIARFPDSNKQLLCAVFGRLPCREFD